MTGWLLAVAVLTLIGVVYLAQASQAAQEGARVETVKQRVSELQRENTQLEVDIAAAQQPDRLSQRAAELGYRPATADEIEYVPVKNYPQPTPEPAAPARAAAVDPLSALWALLTGGTGGGP